MNYDDFCEILRSIEQYITPKEIFGGAKVVKAAGRLTLAIRFMATGETFHSLSFQFRISTSAICYIIREVCKALKEHFMPNYMKIPSSAEEWLDIAKTFEEKCNFPHYLGAVDGKHIVMQLST